MYLSVEIARQTRQLPKTPDMMNTPKMGLAQYSGSEDWASTLDMILDMGYKICDEHPEYGACPVHGIRGLGIHVGEQ